MRFLVIDASVAIKWYINEDDSEAAQNLLQTEFLFLVPDLFFAEVAGGLIRQHRVYRQISRDDVLLAINDLSQVGIEPVPSTVLLHRAVDVSFALGHPIKDCFYLALAERWQTFFVTADLQLADKAKKLDWAKYITPLANAGEIV